MNEESSILFLGDVIPYKPFRFKNNLPVVINLECPVTRSEKPVSGKVSLRVPSNHLEKIFGSKLLAVNLANNHILDYGIAGLNSTISEIGKTGAGYFGINLPADSTHNPLILKFKDHNISFMSVIAEMTTPLVEFDDFNYVDLLDKEEIIERIRSARDKSDRLIVHVHWGMPESSYPSPGQVKTARKMIDAGADAVIGSHSHAPQAVEKYGKGIIAYGLGNFIMPSFRNTPSFFDEEGKPLSSFSKRLMPWNRISWGLALDLETMEYEIRKFVFMADFIVQMRSTPFDRFIHLKEDIFTDSYEKTVSKHLRNRKFRRNIVDLFYNPFHRYL